MKDENIKEHHDLCNKNIQHLAETACKPGEYIGTSIKKIYNGTEEWHKRRQDFIDKNVSEIDKAC